MLWIEEDLGIDADDLMSCMAFESGETFLANVKNPVSSATGLIQFMRATAVGLGTTVEALARMTPEDQLNFVWKYFAPYKGRLQSIEDLYMAILWPAGVGRPLSFTLWIRGTDAYAVNSGLDANRDHKVTKAEAAAKVVEKLNKGMGEGYFG